MIYRLGVASLSREHVSQNSGRSRDYKSEIVLKLSDVASLELVAPINDGLASYNAGTFGPSMRKPVVVTAHIDGEIVAGLNGTSAWGWLYIQWLWVSDAHRGQNIGSSLIQRAEDEALFRGCNRSHIDTFNEKALRLYTRQGYSVFGKLDDYPPGQTKYFLQKKLL